MDPLSALRHRRSTPSRLLGPPGPDAAQLRELLECTVRVPDHGKLAPWRFIAIAGEARTALGEFVAARGLERDPGAAPAVIEKDRARFSHAPLVLAVIARLLPGHKVPEQEQLLSGGALCFQLLLAADALGFGGQWLTGWPGTSACSASCTWSPRANPCRNASAPRPCRCCRIWRRECTPSRSVPGG